MSKTIRATVNRSLLKTDIFSGKNNHHFMSVLKVIGDEAVKKAKAKALKDFDADEITREIQGGAKASNSSDLLGGYGNLWGYLGFESNPLPELRELLDFDVVTTVTPKNKKGSFYIREYIPTLTEIYAETLGHLPYAEGKSWVDAIQNGFPAYGRFLNIEGKGRSTAGIQNAKSSGGVKIKSGNKYVNKILKELEKNLRDELSI